MYPETSTDGYKVDHRRQYPQNTTLVFSNLTPRKTRREGVYKVVSFGLQYFVKKYLIQEWNEKFFSRPKEEVLRRFNRRINNYLGPNGVGDGHIAALHDLGYLPLEIYALPEGTEHPIKTPSVVFWNTLPEFFWLTNYIETVFSTTIWGPCTSATTAHQYKKLLTKYSMETVGNADFIPWQAHDFGARGMFGMEASLMSGGAHLTSFAGTDTISAIDWLEEYYNADSDKELIGGSVPACYDDQTEILTNNGWKLFANLSGDELVAQFNDDYAIEFVRPTAYVKDRYTGKMIKFNKKTGRKYIDAVVTPNHKMVREKMGKIDLFEAGDYSYRNRAGYSSDYSKIVISGKSSSKDNGLSDLERLKIAFQADGSFPSHKEDYTGARGKGFPIRFSLKKERKKERLIKLCEAAGFSFNFNEAPDKRGYYYFWINTSEPFIKDLSWVDLKGFSSRKAQEFLDELQYWDGYKPNNKNCICYSSVDRINIDIIQAIACIGGAKTHYCSYLDKRGDRQLSHSLTIQLNKTTVSSNGVYREEIDYDGYVYCVSVPSKMIVARRNNTVLICGNTEHSVACSTILNFVEKIRTEKTQSGERIIEDELMDLADIEYVRHLIQDVYPTGIISIVADSFDYWTTITKTAAVLKDVIMARDGKVVFRPDTGDPVKVICGYSVKEKIEDCVDGDAFLKDGKYYEVSGWSIGKELMECEVKGSVKCLWDIFRGSLTKKGYWQIDSHAGIIFGDSITLQRCYDICEGLKQKGFSSNNIVFGIGSYTYQYVTRDTDGYAVKATYCEVDGKKINIYKDPKTDDGTKKSACGLLAVFKDTSGELYLEQKTTWDRVRNCEFVPVFKDGNLLKDWSLQQIRDNLAKYL